eukprot:scaffold62455_cov23-Tisochrysis_lutea.AAC.4
MAPQTSWPSVSQKRASRKGPSWQAQTMQTLRRSSYMELPSGYMLRNTRDLQQMGLVWGDLSLGAAVTGKQLLGQARGISFDGWRMQSKLKSGYRRHCKSAAESALEMNARG